MIIRPFFATASLGLFLFLLQDAAHGWGGGRPLVDRRQTLVGIGSSGLAIVFGAPSISHAGIDPTLLKNLPVQGDESGAVQRLRQVEAVQRPSSDLVDIPFTELPSGVSFREYREGKGDAGMDILGTKP